MFEIVQAVVLGIVQGATEFIPVSSDGHLAIVPWLLGWSKSGEHSLLFDTMLHWGTLLSVFLVFGRDLWNMVVAGLQSIARRSLADPYARLAWLVVVGTIPVVLVGFYLQDFFEGLFASPRAAAFGFFVTAAILAGSEYLVRHRPPTRGISRLGWWDSLLIGAAQTIALAPGISRSGSTISTALLRGVRREDAARFSFLLGTPAILGAGLLQLVDALATDSQAVAGMLPVLAAGFLAAMITGIVAIRFMLSYLRRHSLYAFAAYCTILGSAVLVLTYFYA